MKRTIQTITQLAICVAAMAGVPALSHADETNTAAATTPGTASDESGPSQVGRSRNFYGAVTAVDTNAMTFTAGGQTYMVTAKTEIPKSKDGQTATRVATVALAGVVVGESARFTIKGTDGKLYVTKLRLGKDADDYIGGGKKKKTVGTTDADSKAAAPPN